jgi:5-oxopent-3-ene-1,2,5-tricarboxylate decarboxylase / 2-hydroxyhepta-2,4-diene-1,7-dioate isomerase
MSLLEFAPYRLSGVVYGTLLNHIPAYEALGQAMTKPPYKAAPVAPVLYIKPRNTLAGDGDSVWIPAGVSELEIGASLGIVIGRTACRLTLAEAMEYVAGYVIVNDVSVPHDNYYRPSIRFKARDGFCPIGTAVHRDRVADPGLLEVRVSVDGTRALLARTDAMRRTAAQLLVDVTDFMTLSPGDIITLGAMAPAPRVRAGQTVRIEIENLGALTTPIIGEAK